MGGALDELSSPEHINGLITWSGGEGGSKAYVCILRGHPTFGLRLLRAARTTYLGRDGKPGVVYGGGGGSGGCSCVCCGQTNHKE